MKEFDDGERRVEIFDKVGYHYLVDRWGDDDWDRVLKK